MTFDRRRFLYGGAGALGTATLSLPLLPSLARAQSEESVFPLRLVVFFSGNGTIRDAWMPQHDSGRITALSPILRPLEPHLDKLMVVDGLNLEAANHQYQPKSGFHGHERGLGCILTGRRLELGPYTEGSGFPAGQSVNTYLSDRLGDASPLGSLPVGILSRPNNQDLNRTTMSFLGPDQPQFMEYDGAKLFTQIFGQQGQSEQVYQQTLRRQRSVLDFLNADLKRVQERLSSEDRIRLDKHLDTFETLERQLTQTIPACEATTLPQPQNWLDANESETTATFQLTQTVEAMACDRVRIATVQFGGGLGGVSLRAIGDPEYANRESWHYSSHNSDEESVENIVAINTFIAGKFAQLLDLMDSVVEGERTLLDNSIVLWVNELANGQHHTYDSIPLVVAGGGKDYFKTGGTFVDVGGRTNNDLLLSLIHAFGFSDVSEFGMEGLTTGPLDALRA
ncbi:MAG: DUF1552 domain-containing protein [Myxococcota bacterium]